MFDKTDYVSQSAAALAADGANKATQGPILSAVNSLGVRLSETLMLIEALETRLDPVLGAHLPEAALTSGGATQEPASPLHAALIDSALHVETRNKRLRQILDRLTL